MPDPEDTAPQTSPDKADDGAAATVSPSMSDEQIRSNLRKAYIAYAEDLTVEFTFNPDIADKSLSAFKQLMREGFETHDEQFRPRFEALKNDVVEELAPKLYPGSSPARNVHVSRQHDPVPDGKNTAQAADPVNLFNGEFFYEATDFQLNGAGMDFVFTRSYSQHSAYDGPLGRCWDHTANLWIRVEDDPDTLFRSTGRLREQRFLRHELFGYFLPPDGSNGVITEEAGSFVFRQPDGTRFIYAPHQTRHPSIHVVSRIVDRFGNAVDFDYAGGLLVRIRVNHPDRTVNLVYDSADRIVAVSDFTGRTWRYHYDDMGDLAAVLAPGTEQHPEGGLLRYDYLGSSVGDRRLQHCLIGITDADGRRFLENEYGDVPNLVSYGRVVRQRQGKGEISFDYSDVVEVFNTPYEAYELPAHQTILTARDGKQTRFLFNSSGAMLMREEYARLDGIPKRVSWQFRYNRDGNLVGMISPLGAVTQALYGRDLYERRFSVADGTRPQTDSNLTAEARLGFDQLLAVVRRVRFYGPSELNLAGGLWSSQLFPDIFSTTDADVVQKFTYEPLFGLPATVSDPNWTRSANPDFPENTDYHRRLTRYRYRGPQGLLDEAELPTPTNPDGTFADPVLFRFPDYDDHGRLLRAIAPNGLETAHRYADPSAGIGEGHLLSSTVDPGGAAITEAVERNARGQVVRVLRAQAAAAGDGRFVTTQAYDALGRLIRHVDTAPMGIETRFFYSRGGALMRRETDLRDEEGTRTGTLVVTYRYDEELNAIAETIGDGSEEKTARTVFDRAGRPALSISPGGRKDKSAFNERSSLWKQIEDHGGVAATTRAYYDADGRIARLINPRGFVTRFRRDAMGRPIDIQDAEGGRTILQYDKIGQPLVECRFAPATSGDYKLLSRREFSYDELGRVATAATNWFTEAEDTAEVDLATAFATSGPGELLVHRHFYDASGNLVRVVDQDGREFVSEYDRLGREIRALDPDGNEARFAYDEEANLTRIDRIEVRRDPASGAVVGLRCYAETFGYDELNRLIERKTPTGTTRYRYDSRGNRVEVTDQLGFRTRDAFDIFSRLVAQERVVATPQGDQIVRLSRSYDRDDQPVSQTDALGRVTQFRYDSNGRLVGTGFPDDSWDDAEYDRAGNMVRYRDRTGRVRDTEWDGLNRAVRSRFTTATILPSAAADYRAEYDGLGRLTVAANDFCTTRFTYDSLDNPVEEAATFAAPSSDPSRVYRTSRRYSSTGALLELLYPSGRRLRFEHDRLDRTIAITQLAAGTGYPGDPAQPDAVQLASFAYDGLQLGKIARANGITTDLSYDAGFRLAELAHTEPGGNLLTVQLLHDARHNLREMRELAQDFASTMRHRYDALSRLVEVDHQPGATLITVPFNPPEAPLPAELPDLQAPIDAIASAGLAAAIRYNLDSVGNRRTVETDGSVQVFETNDLDQYVTVDGTDLRYDANGNLVEDNHFIFEYDGRNQLVQFRAKASGQTTSYFHDYFGRRCAQANAQGASLFIYQAFDPIEEYRDGTLLRSLVGTLHGEPPLIDSTAGREFHLLADHRHSVRYLLEGSNRLGHYVYDPYGLLVQSAGGEANPFRFAGRRQIDETGRYDFGFRVYDPALGRFLQRDPKGYVDGSNLYAFLRNNPLINSDPLGLESRGEHGPMVSKLGMELAYRHPEGFTLSLPDRFDAEKIAAMKQRIQNPLDRGVGIRGLPPDGRSTSRTSDIRARDDLVGGNMDNYRNALSPTDRATIGRGRGRNHIDHVVELQTIIRSVAGVFAPGADTTRPQDYRLQEATSNSTDGKQLADSIREQIRNGAPQDTPAGGVARARDVNKFWNRPGYRSIMRFGGLYNAVGGTGATLSDMGDDIREGRFGSAALNASGAAGSMLELGGMAARSATLLRYGRFIGAPAAVLSSGVLGVRIGTNLYENYVDKQMSLDAGSWVEEKTGSRILGATAAAATAVGDAIYHAPEAAYDYARETWTLDPDEIDWDRTFKPWKWF